MKKIMLVAILSFLAQVFSAMYTVDGYAYLEGQTDHSGIKVFFQRVAPDATFSYTVYTDTAGYYSQSSENGIYNITYSKTNYLDSLSAGISLYSNTTLGDVILKKKTNIIGAGTHVYSADLVVAEGDTLIIEPGARLEFMEGKRFIVNGLLLAQGTEEQKIYITAYSTQKRGYLIFNDSSNDNSILSYCVIEKSKESGVYLDNASAIISHSKIQNNYTTLYPYGGGGLVSINSHSVISDCEFKDNYIPDSAYELYGAGICSWRSFLTLDNCIFNNNENYADSGFGDGITVFENEITVLNSLFMNHDTYSAIYNLNGSLIVSNSIFQNNITGIVDHGNSVTVENSIFFGNSNNGIVTNNNLKIINSILAYNGFDGINISYRNAYVSVYNSIIVNNGNYGINQYHQVYGELIVEFCNVYNNTIGNFNSYCNEYLGVNVTTNSNGDPCDAWYNISLDPKFIDASNGDHTLMSDSPCIDSGTNTIDGYDFPAGDIIDNYRIWDGDGNGSDTVDIGPYEYGSISTSIENEQTVSEFMLYQNYPNPFNPITTISYALPSTGQVELSVYNLQGQIVQNLVNRNQDKGIHKAEFNGAGLTSGMYIYGLKVGGKVVVSRKMMLLK